MFYDALFISPHLDDAVLSAGGMISAYSRKKKRVCVYTVITEGCMGRYSEDAQKFLHDSGSSDADALFRSRKEEDRKALSLLGSAYVHGGFTDAIFRKNKSGKLIYDSFKSVFSGNISREDAIFEEEVTRALRQFMLTSVRDETEIYLPLGVGNHVDHLVTFNAGRRTFGNRITYWEDVPYRSNSIQIFSRLAYLSSINASIIGHNVLPTGDYGRKKIMAIGKYKSQIRGLVKSGLSTADNLYEMYYTANNG